MTLWNKNKVNIDVKNANDHIIVNERNEKLKIQTFAIVPKLGF